MFLINESHGPGHNFPSIESSRAMRRPGGVEVAVAHSLPLPVRKFRCLARVTAYQPQDVTQMCHRSEDVQQTGSPGATCHRTVCTMQSSIFI